MHTRTKFPVGKEEIVSHNKIKQWNYLKVIPFDITKTDAIKVGLLIDANYMKVLESKVISKVDGGTYPCQTRLGWCIVGPIINMISKKIIGCNQVAVIDAAYSNISSHHSVMEEAMNKVSLEKMFQTMYKSDFNKASTIKVNSRVLKDVEEFSSEDRRFLQIVEEKTK